MTITDADRDEDLADEIAEAISDTLDMDWQPKWAAPSIIAIINRERRIAREEGAKAMQKIAIDVGARLAAAISLLERGGKAAKKAAPSDRMFDQMLVDYKASLERLRTALALRAAIEAAIAREGE